MSSSWMCRSAPPATTHLPPPQSQSSSVMIWRSCDLATATYPGAVQGGVSPRFCVRVLRFRPHVHVLCGLAVRLIRPVRLNPAGVGQSCEHLGITRAVARCAATWSPGLDIVWWRRSGRCLVSEHEPHRRCNHHGNCQPTKPPHRPPRACPTRDIEVVDHADE